MEQRSFLICFKNKRYGSLQVPADLSREDYELLKQQVDAHMEIIELLLSDTETDRQGQHAHL